jgi:hypothetical protein
MSQPWDYIAKLVCIGDSGTGKSSVSLVLSASSGPKSVLTKLCTSSLFASAKVASPLLTMSPSASSSVRGLSRLDPLHHRS